jgi:periplasmic protein TonB
MTSRFLETKAETMPVGEDGWSTPPRELQISHLAGIGVCVGILFGVGVFLLQAPAMGPAHRPSSSITPVTLTPLPQPGTGAKQAAPSPDSPSLVPPPLPAIAQPQVTVARPPQPEKKAAEPAKTMDERRSKAMAALEAPPDMGELRDLASSSASDFQSLLLDHIKHFCHYPEAARAAHIHGVVHLLFSMDRAGRVLGVWIEKSSGYPILDREAIDAVRRAQPLPPIPAGLPSRLPVTLPVEFAGQ